MAIKKRELTKAGGGNTGGEAEIGFGNVAKPDSPKRFNSIVQTARQTAHLNPGIGLSELRQTGSGNIAKTDMSGE